MWSTAATLGGHLLKAGFNWVKNNPEKVGKGIGKLGKYAASISPKFGGRINRFIKKSSKLSSEFAPKNSYMSKLSKSIRNNNSSSKKLTNDSSMRSGSRRYNVGGYVGAL